MVAAPAKDALFFNCSYVCPEPVLAKRRICSIKTARKKEAFFIPPSRSIAETMQLQTSAKHMKTCRCDFNAILL
jgi:hypothetical protein